MGFNLIYWIDAVADQVIWYPALISKRAFSAIFSASARWLDLVGLTIRSIPRLRCPRHPWTIILYFA
jgi:hypothetical protein